MNDQLKCETAMFVRVHRLILDRPMVPPNVKATAHIAQIAAAKDAMLLSGGVKIQGTGEFRAAAAERRVVIRQLRGKMREIAETAKALNKTGAHPGLDLQFRMPGKTMQDLRDRAVAFKTALEPIKQDFIDYDSPATVVEDLEAAIAEFDEATDRRYAGLGKQIGATAGLKIIARKGVIAVRALTAIMIKRYRDEPGLLAEWIAAQRISGWPTPATVAEIVGGDGSGSGTDGGSTPPASGS